MQLMHHPYNMLLGVKKNYINLYHENQKQNLSRMNLKLICKAWIK